MKVKDLISELQKLSPEHEIYAICDDVEITNNAKVAEVFSVDYVNSHLVATSRGDDGKPVINLFPEEKGRMVGIIKLTTDF